MIAAGLPQDVCPESGEWLFVDVGFSSEKKSCGVLGDDDAAPNVLTFADASARIIAAAALEEPANTTSKATLNLLIEAPFPWRSTREAIQPDEYSKGCGRSIATGTRVAAAL
jgi:hypothetical protein